MIYFVSPSMIFAGEWPPGPLVIYHRSANLPRGDSLS